MPADRAESGGTANFFMRGNTEIIVLDLKGAFSKMKYPVERRAFPPLARHACLEAIFAKRWCGGEIAGRIAVDRHKASARFQATGDTIQHRREIFPIRRIVEQISRDDQIVFFIELQISAIPNQVADTLRALRFLLTSQSDHFLGEIHTRDTRRTLLAQNA